MIFDDNLCYYYSMNIEIIKEQRRTIALKLLNSQNAVLKVPKRLSDKKAQEFLDSKQKWLENSAKKLAELEKFSNSFDFGKYIYLNGKNAGEVDDIVIGKANKTNIKKFYLSLFGSLRQRAEELSNLSGLKYAQIKPTNSCRIWGSYNVKGEMKLNWRLVILPDEFVTYVICHELCHSLHFNHKPKFWRDLEKICPNCRKLRKNLESFGFVLKAI